jgi:hypothetical protein
MDMPKLGTHILGLIQDFTLWVGWNIIFQMGLSIITAQI